MQPGGVHVDSSCIDRARAGTRCIYKLCVLVIHISIYIYTIYVYERNHFCKDTCFLTVQHFCTKLNETMYCDKNQLFLQTCCTHCPKNRKSIFLIDKMPSEVPGSEQIVFCFVWDRAALLQKGYVFLATVHHFCRKTNKKDCSVQKKPSVFAKVLCCPKTPNLWEAFKVNWLSDPRAARKRHGAVLLVRPMFF